MEDDIIITRKQVFPTRRAVIVIAWRLLREQLEAMTDDELRRGRRVIVKLHFVPGPGRAVQTGEFIVGGYVRFDISKAALEDEINKALNRGAI